MKYVIIGNGVAGIHAAEAIRSLDGQGEIVMVSDEAPGLYCRPMIGMVLEGSVPEAELPIRTPDFYEKAGVRAVLGQRVTGIDVDAGTVSLPGGRSIAYDRLLVAAGADPRPVRAEGLHLERIFYMRTERDVRGMLEAIPDARRALVLGGGLVGFKAAYGLLRRGLETTMLVRSGYPLSMQVDETAGKMILDELVSRGLKVETGVEAEAFEGNGAVRSARLSDGSELPCDMVVVGKGVLPCRSFIPRDRIRVDLGVLVDEHLRTSDPRVYAAGDAAESVDVARGTRWVNAIWPEAAGQGRVAGMNMAGRSVKYPGSLSRNVIRIFGLDVMTAGLASPSEEDGCESASRSNLRKGIYRKLVFREDRLVGAVLVGDIDQGGVFMNLIRSGMRVTVSRESLLSGSFNAGRLMAVAARRSPGAFA